MHARRSSTRLLADSVRNARRALSTQGLGTRFDVRAGQLSASGQHYRVAFGVDAARAHLGSAVHAAGVRKLLLVRDRDAGAASRAQYAEFLLLQAGVPCFQYTLSRDCATLAALDDAHATARRVGADGVLAFGGGAAIDTARALALMLTNGGDAADYVRRSGDENSSSSSDFEPPAPHFLVPTIAGAGAEISTDALVLDEDDEAKLVFGAGPIVAEGALTALGQCIESYLSGCQDEATEMLALQGVEVIAAAFAQPLVEGTMDLKSVGLREKFALGSLFSGIAASSSGFGCAHSLAVSMGGISDLPHAQVASAFLPFVFDKYAALAQENEGDEFFDALRAKLESVGDRLTAASGFQGASVAAWMRYVSSRFGLPTTATLELDEGLVKGIVDRAAQRQEASIAHRELAPVLGADDIRALLDDAIIVASGETTGDKEERQ
ncbi:hypothetical protein PybrP1_010583 [[Pythium] brassicae (nom. inval.)]|nr:hypothetical protein PybrP1_010583 [[Pythium] brassicae (nom. inval.)]